jgi:SAM-dependent methyltransferase
MLHIAAERCLRSRFRTRLDSGYLTADLEKPAMVRMDITDIQYPDESFDAICCSHVLEHVPDDRRAMREICRVLKSSGWAILLVPITADRTFEDPSVTDPEERLRLFGQADHVRRYGPDYTDRLREAGFGVEVVCVSDLVGEKQARRMGLIRHAGAIYYCTRP